MSEIKKSMWAVGIRYEGAVVLFATEAEADVFIAKANELEQGTEETEFLNMYCDLYKEELPIR